MPKPFVSGLEESERRPGRSVLCSFGLASAKCNYLKRTAFYVGLCATVQISRLLEATLQDALLAAKEQVQQDPANLLTA